MPFAVRKTDDGAKVVNKDTGRVLGTHGSVAKAKKQLAAVNINYYGKNASLFRELGALAFPR